MRAKTAVMVGMVLGLVLVAAPAWAGGSSTDSPACGYAPAGWNAPKGAIVFTRGSGVIKGVIDGVGEYRTHTMISYGPNSWVIHNTAFNPGTNDVCKACDNPIREGELRQGYPGASSVSQGGIYTDLYADGAPSFIAWGDGGTNGQTVANNTQACLGPVWTASIKNGSYGLYRFRYPNGAYIPYWPYGGFMGRSGDVSDDNPFYSTDATHALATAGAICSTFPAYLQRHFVGATVSRKDYGTTVTCNGAKALRDAVESECNSGQGFWTSLGAGIACTFCDLDTNVCDDAGRQAAWCFSSNNCEKGGSTYSCPSVSSVTISPDRVGSWQGAVGSIWAAQNNTLSWNQGGSQYGCWF